MPGEQTHTGGKPYLRIIQGGLVNKVTEDTDGAMRRDWESPNGSGTAWELRYSNWEGKIISIEFKEGKYGDECIIEFDDAFLTVKTDDRYFQDLASKLPNVDLSKSVKLHPYNMEVEDGKYKTGVSVQQGGEKIASHYWDGKKKTNGFPEVDEALKEKKGKKYWPLYFGDVADFLVEELGKLKFEAPVEEIEEMDLDDMPTDLPFDK